MYIEALSQGLAIICSKGQGVDGYFSDSSIVRAVESTNKYEIAQSLIDLAHYSGVTKRRCIDAASSFKWSIIAKKYNEIYSKILRSKN